MTWCWGGGAASGEDFTGGILLGADGQVYLTNGMAYSTYGQHGEPIKLIYCPIGSSDVHVGGMNGLFLDGGSFNGDGSGLKDLLLAISGTNGTAPVNGTNAQAWVKVTLPDGSVWKMGLHK